MLNFHKVTENIENIQNFLVQATLVKKKKNRIIHGFKEIMQNKTRQKTTTKKAKYESYCS